MWATMTPRENASGRLTIVSERNICFSNLWIVKVWLHMHTICDFTRQADHKFYEERQLNLEVVQEYPPASSSGPSLAHGSLKEDVS